MGMKQNIVLHKSTLRACCTVRTLRFAVRIWIRFALEIMPFITLQNEDTVAKAEYYILELDRSM